LAGAYVSQTGTSIYSSSSVRCPGSHKQFRLCDVLPGQTGSRMFQCRVSPPTTTNGVLAKKGRSFCIRGGVSGSAAHGGSSPMGVKGRRSSIAALCCTATRRTCVYMCALRRYVFVLVCVYISTYCILFYLYSTNYSARISSNI